MVEAPTLEEELVTGSRIRRDATEAAMLELDRDDLAGTGLTNLGDALQNLPITGSAPNSQFNVPGNSVFPQDGSGIGAGSAQVSLRNFGAKRTLVLVDGRRWVAGASAVYGSDAIGGVVNIVTDRDFEGLHVDAQAGGYLQHGDGESTALDARWGVGNGTTHVVLSASWRDELGIGTADRRRSAFPNPDATSCDVPGSYCSSFTPQGRFVLGPAFDFASITLNDGVLNDGGAHVPAFDPADPTAGDFHAFTSADRFNYNGLGFNYLRTPNERANLFGTARQRLGPQLQLLATATYTHRSSATKAAPEPLCLGNGCGNPINDRFVVSAHNPYNPFGTDLSVANGTLEFFGRRPLESGPRLFFQDTRTYFATVGLEGEFAWRDRALYWEAYGSYGDNHGWQKKRNSHNAAKLQVAVGDPAVCAATPGCVPFNFFGGRGPDGQGSITREMLEFVTYTQRDERRRRPMVPAGRSRIP